MAALSQKTSSSAKLVPSPNGTPNNFVLGASQAHPDTPTISPSTNLNSISSTSHPTALNQTIVPKDDDDDDVIVAPGDVLREGILGLFFKKKTSMKIWFELDDPGDHLNNNESHAKTGAEQPVPTTDETSPPNSDSAGVVDFMVHATSITRFDTAHMDFDQRLVDCIENSYAYDLNIIRENLLNLW